MAHKLYTIRLFESPRARWRSTDRIKKLPDRAVIAANEAAARNKILALFFDEGRPVYFLFFGLHDCFTCVVGAQTPKPPRSGENEGEDPSWF